ncbi:MULTISPECIES: FKBP-type peptidyl-prolyl cis-trans isomerase [unclassified Parafrankia]|uniref:FKBP-type peptidyl-prolyl cis-trans isomerase n=1 Tax=unclassified Parafrankia TaxID=2994368 RepID=UPI000DA48837|nr:MULTISPECIES: FKBP-type peptidyl-prolyl cis-trans isomerase [unclassified Parafrankia]TCJ32691.1 FKBP-type peptidyl-prolyl cis-trans isomerase [Parafrankia sp. BMG5.11]SQD94412.1 Peptidyl-prolyl cis-trans isomerase [Parafrankia sp. Ea1.12]
MGVTIETISPGDGKNFPKKGDTVAIHYVGTFLTVGHDDWIGGGNPQPGDEFDSSRDRGSPFVVPIGVGKVIRGWDEGIPQLSLGEKAFLDITSDDAYGHDGFPPIIPPDSDLRFEVELLDIKSRGQRPHGR